MKRRQVCLSVSAFGAAMAALSVAANAGAAGPTTPECLSAAEESVQLRAEHKLHAARARALVCSESTCPADVRAECVRRIDVINSSLPTLVFDAKDAEGNDVTGLKVTMDGQALTVPSEGAAISIDPGEHLFLFDTPAGGHIEKRLIAREGEKQRREPIVFASPGNVALVASSPERAGGARPMPLGGSPETSKANPRLPISFALGGIGLVGLGTGAVFGLVAQSKWSASETACASATQCPQHDQAVRDHDSAASAAMFSTVAFVAGGALVAAGAVLYFTAPAGRQTGRRWRLEPMVGSGAGGLALKAGW